MRPRTAAMIGGGALLVVMALPVVSASRATQRLWSMGEATGDRLRSFEAIVDLALQRPLQGHGLGTFREALTPAMTQDDLWLLWNLGAAHNIAVQWLVETGLIGLGLGVAMITALMASLSPLPLKRSVPGRGRVIGILAFSVVLLAHNMVDYSLQIASVTALWALLLGLAAGSAFQGDHKGKPA
jgi:O-antigen ligase